MLQRTYRLFLLLLTLVIFSRSSYAQNITIRMLDAKTGTVISNTTLIVRIDHQEAQHADWAVRNDDGSAQLKIPFKASLVTLSATYNDSTEIYINCDSLKDKKDPSVQWYSIATILSTGIVAPDYCSKSKEIEKQTITAKPGEFVFLVRQQNWKEQMKDY